MLFLSSNDPLKFVRLFGQGNVQVWDEWTLYYMFSILVWIGPSLLLKIIEKSLGQGGLHMYGVGQVRAIHKRITHVKFDFFMLIIVQFEINFTSVLFLCFSGK